MYVRCVLEHTFTKVARHQRLFAGPLERLLLVVDIVLAYRWVVLYVLLFYGRKKAWCIP
jgi:hypothetical protein